MFFYLILFIILIPIILIATVIFFMVKAFKGNKPAVNYITDEDWQELLMLEEQRKRLATRVKSLQTILINDFPNLSIPMLADNTITMSRTETLASVLVDKLEDEIKYLEQHIFRLETVLDTQLPNWRNA